LAEYRKKKDIYDDLRKMGRELKEKSALVLSKEMKAYNRVIKRAGLVDRGVVTLKGRVTCEINSHHEILLTDLIFTGFFNDMNPIEIASLLSSMVH
jgi:ATP-dependent RNA helicase DOB1